MAKKFAGGVLISAALALSACGRAEKTPTAEQSALPAAQETAVISDPDAGEARNLGPEAAELAYIVSQFSPLLDEPQKRAISQDFHGAPLATEPAVHFVTAERVSCRARTESVGAGVVCAIDYGQGQVVEIGEEDAQALYDALGALGVEAESGMSHLERTITALNCTVDDGAAQTLSSTGSHIEGFACQFRVET